MSDEYRTRDQYWDYKDYLKYRCGNNYYNKGLDYKKAGNNTKAIEFFRLALSENSKDQDFIKQVQLLSSIDASCNST